MKRIAIVTGASSGLGKEFTKQISSPLFNKDSFDEIWIIARREDKLRELEKEINIDKKLVKSVPLDISGIEGAKKFRDFLESESCTTCRRPIPRESF